MHSDTLNWRSLRRATWSNLLYYPRFSTRFHQVKMNEQDRQKTAFKVGLLGLYGFIRMPFGLCNSPSTFQRLMEACLWQKTLEYFSFILMTFLCVFKSFEEHLQRFEIVFKRLRSHGLKIKHSKCQFFHKEVKYLGHIGSGESVKVDSDQRLETTRVWKRIMMFSGV